LRSLRRWTLGLLKHETVVLRLGALECGEENVAPSLLGIHVRKHDVEHDATTEGTGRLREPAYLRVAALQEGHCEVVKRLALGGLLRHYE
jgi:hypothetical protein